MSMFLVTFFFFAMDPVSGFNKVLSGYYVRRRAEISTTSKSSSVNNTKFESAKPRRSFIVKFCKLEGPFAGSLFLSVFEKEAARILITHM